MRIILLLGLLLFSSGSDAHDPDEVVAQFDGGGVIDDQGFGVIQIGVNGTEYLLDSRGCSGGLVFEKPVAVQFICFRGFYIARDNACSAKGQRILGGKELLCKEFDENEMVIQSLIAVTNPYSPEAHTVSFYEDRDLLTNLRRFSVGDAKTYSDDDEEERSGGFGVVVGGGGGNSSNETELNVGKVCVRGGLGAFSVPSLEGITSGGFLTTPCDASSAVVEAEKEAQFEGEAAGVFFEHNLKKRGLHPDDTVIIDIKNGTGSGSGTTESSGGNQTGPWEGVGKNETEPWEGVGKNETEPWEGVGKNETEPWEGVGKNETEPWEGVGRNETEPWEGVGGGPSPSAGLGGESSTGSSATRSSEEFTTSTSPPVKQYNETDVSEDLTSEETSEEDVVGGGSTAPGGSRDGEDTLPIKKPVKGAPTVVDQAWGDDFDDGESGRSGSIKGQVATKNESSEEYIEYRDEADDDEDLGSWENLGKVLANNEFTQGKEQGGTPIAVGSLEYDALVGGIERLFDTPTSPCFESYLNIVKRQIEHAVLNCGKENDTKCSNVLEGEQPDLERNKWYSVLTKVFQVVKAVVPDEVVADAFFDDALMLFGYYARVVRDLDALGGGSGYGQGMFGGMMKGLDECVKRVGKSSFLAVNFTVKEDEVDCSVNTLESSRLRVRGWSEYTKSYSDRKTVEYEYRLASTDPNGYLPPASSRFNPRLWFPAEVVFYAVQLAYASCFEDEAGEMGVEDPNGFFRLQGNVIENVLGSRIVSEAWRTAGRGLTMYENMAPWINHSARVTPGSNMNDFVRLLRDLDRVSFAIHEVSTTLNHWMVRGITGEEGVARPVSYGNRGSKWSLVLRRADKKINNLRRKRRDVTETHLENPSENLTENPAEIPTESLTENPTQTDDPLKEAALWDGLAYCLTTNEKESGQGVTKQFGFSPGLETFVSRGVCTL